MTKAKKSLGQHFLVHDQIAERIAGYALDEGQKNILEVGPGKGMLTKCFLAEDVVLKAIDADGEMIEFLKSEYPQRADCFLHGDFLNSDIKKLFAGEECLVAGNFPYNISSQIVIKVIENRELVPAMLGMFQKEVAERILQKEGSKKYGITSVLTQAYYEGEQIMQLAAGNFDPPPKVDSTVLILRRKAREDWIQSPYPVFRKVVRAAFGKRRKMLRNSLKGFIDPQQLRTEKIFTRRPETLSVEEFDHLAGEVIVE